LLAGLLAGMIGFAAYGMAPTGDMFMLGVPVFAFMGLFGPSAQGLMTRLVKRTEQGQLQGANSSLMGITGLIGPGLFTLTFATFIGPRADLHLPGAPFLLASLLMAIAALLAWRVTRKIPTAGPDKVGGAS
jgi:DHA1 family tetracycline resistance protein-like MFS transporter